MTQRIINHTIRSLALGAAVAVAFAACKSTTEPTAQAGPPPSVAQRILGTWVVDVPDGQAEYIEFAKDGTARVWAGFQPDSVLENLDFDLTWVIKDEAPFDVVIAGFGVNVRPRA